MNQLVRNLIYILFIKLEIITLVGYWKLVVRFLMPDNWQHEFSMLVLFLMLSTLLIFIFYISLAVSFYKEYEVDLFG